MPNILEEPVEGCRIVYQGRKTASRMDLPAGTPARRWASELNRSSRGWTLGKMARRI